MHTPVLFTAFASSFVFYLESSRAPISGSESRTRKLEHCTLHSTPCLLLPAPYMYIAHAIASVGVKAYLAYPLPIKKSMQAKAFPG